MKIEVRVKPGAKEPAKKGRANEAVVEAMAKHFAVPKSFVTIKEAR